VLDNAAIDGIARKHGLVMVNGTDHDKEDGYGCDHFCALYASNGKDCVCSYLTYSGVYKGSLERKYFGTINGKHDGDGFREEILTMIKTHI
jgi:hypothetical protein